MLSIKLSISSYLYIHIGVSVLTNSLRMAEDHIFFESREILCALTISSNSIETHENSNLYYTMSQRSKS